MKLQLDHLLIYAVIILTYYVGLATANADAHIADWSAFSRGAFGFLFILSTLLFLLVCIANEHYENDLKQLKKDNNLKQGNG